VVRKTRHLDDESDKFFTILEMICSKHDIELIDTLVGAEVTDFFRAWQDASGVSLGESPASQS
jgi:hypothetical protein